MAARVLILSVTGGWEMTSNILRKNGTPAAGEIVGRHVRGNFLWGETVIGGERIKVWTFSGVIWFEKEE
jgi:hypothetical protein